MTAGSGVSCISSENALVSMTIMAERLSEVGRRVHQAVIGKLEIGAAEGGEAGVDGQAHILRWRRLADGAAKDIAGFLFHRKAVHGGAHAQVALQPGVEVSDSDPPLGVSPDLRRVQH